MRYKVVGTATVEIVTWVEADSEEEALNEAEDRDINIPCNGSEFLGYESDNEFILVDGSSLNMPENLAVEDYDEEE